MSNFSCSIEITVHDKIKTVFQNNLFYFQFQQLSIISFNSFPPFWASHLKSSPGIETYNEGRTDFCNSGISDL